MGTGTLIFLLVAMGLLVLAAVFYVVAGWLRRLRRAAIERLRADVGGETVYNVEDCNYFGLQSAGHAQVRGNGVMALTDKGIHFRMLAPDRYRFVPLESITGVSNPRWFLNKSKARALLRVDFLSGGDRDACAWLVRNLDWWNLALRALMEGGRPPQRLAVRRRAPTL